MEHQLHFGRKFYLDKKTGYWISTDYPRIRAHVWVWSCERFQVPKGMHVHHLDENKSNNSIENLALIAADDHARLHMTEEKREWSRHWVAVIRPMTKEWHSSEEGRKWHRQHAIRYNFGNGPEFDYHCQQCNKPYKSKLKAKGRTRFCSNACKSSCRRDSGVDDIEMKCENCDITFKRNKYAKSRFCSKSCGCSRIKNKVNKET